jgi:hypothetical protein
MEHLALIILSVKRRIPLSASIPDTDEKGSVFVLMLGCILLILYFAALVIDLGKAEYTTHSMQRTVDAASLAGASELVFGTSAPLDKWRNAKRTVLGTIRKNPVFATYTFPNLSAPGNHQGGPDKCENTGDYRSQIYDNGKIRIKLERGVYVEGNAPPFNSLESSATCNATATPAPNAVRLTLTVYNYSNVFAVIPPFDKPLFTEITRTAIGAEVD